MVREDLPGMGYQEGPQEGLLEMGPQEGLPEMDPQEGLPEMDPQGDHLEGHLEMDPQGGHPEMDPYGDLLEMLQKEVLLEMVPLGGHPEMGHLPEDPPEMTLPAAPQGMDIVEVWSNGVEDLAHGVDSVLGHEECQMVPHEEVVVAAIFQEAEEALPEDKI